ncbi:MAG TPA: DoxX family protein [Bacteroidota bacterium]|nr:DoxX family protein [Bacteroidota bacterium]
MNQSIRFSLATLLLRILVGGVFLAEGIQKFLFSDELGVGRFEKIGIPMPAFSAPFVGVVEILFGAFLIVGLYTTVAAIPLLINILTAIATTKIPMLIHNGFWKMVHEARTDFSMVVGLIVILLIGGGEWSLDAMRRRRVGSMPSGRENS